MKGILVAALVGLQACGAGYAQKPPLLPEKDVAALVNEISGETVKRNLEGIAQFHRQRGSQGFHAAAELVAQRLREYGLSDVAILQFPADGATMYGTQRSRPVWDAEFAELRELRTEILTCDEVSGKSRQQIAEEEKEMMARQEMVACDAFGNIERTIESYGAEPVVLAEDSESADVTAQLVDVGVGTKESDYTGKDVKGKIVLVSAQPGAVQDLAVGKFGAVGIVSYAQNQKTAWAGENLDAIRWGHLETFSVNKTFGFIVSLRTARSFQERLAKGERIRLHAVVKAGQHAGNYEVVTATIPGADAKLKAEEIAFSCHLDHQRPGANDNASGCATILEVARTLQKLISQHDKESAQPPPHTLVNLDQLERPARTMRFIFPPEIEGTMALLNSDYDSVYPLQLKKDNTRVLEDGSTYINIVDYKGGTSFFPFYKHIKAVIHMDMVGGAPETKAVFHVTRGPISLPSFVQDVAWSFAEWVNEESYRYAAGLKAEYPMVSAEGGKEPLRAEYSAYTMGSDHDVYQDSSFGIPAIYLNDWPDRFIHTNLDAPGNIDATKLKRAGFIGAASGYFLAGLSTANLPKDGAAPLSRVLLQDRLRNFQELLQRCDLLNANDCEVEIRPFLSQEIGKVDSLQWFGAIDANWRQMESDHLWALRKQILDGGSIASGALVSHEGVRWQRLYRKGPMAVFGYDYFGAEWMKRGHMTKPALLEYEGLWGAGDEYAYEVLNFANGKRNAQDIRDGVSAEYGPVPLELVVEYLKALEEIGVVGEVK